MTKVSEAERERIRAGIRRKQALDIDPTLDPKIQKEEEVSLQLIEESRGGARARSERIARGGLPRGNKNQEITTKKRDAVQYRACRALLWERERILHETGWSLQWLMSIENYIAEEDRRIWSETDSRVVFATHREQQLQIMKELEDLGKIFRKSKQYSALVSAARTRADILDRLVKTGQELGVIHKTAKQVEVTGSVDITQLDVKELRVHITQQLGKVQQLLGPAATEGGSASAVMSRLERSFKGEVIDVTPEAPSKAPPVRKARRKRLREPAGEPEQSTG